MAGQHPSGEMIVEHLLVAPQQEPGSYQLLKSPLFVRGIARGDVIASISGSEPKGAFKLLQHSGNLCIRVLSKLPLSAIEPGLSAAIEKLGGDVDLSEERALVYSIHVSCGFSAIEKILSEHLAAIDDIGWYYGNVYDPVSGEPLNWWQALLAPE